MFYILLKTSVQETNYQQQQPTKKKRPLTYLGHRKTIIKIRKDERYSRIKNRMTIIL